MIMADTPKEIQAKLARVEATTGRSGAVPFQPKQQLLDASAVQEKKKDKRIRWVNLRNPDKVMSRIAEGYRRIPESEGGKSLGEEMALFELPREEYERRVTAIRERNEQLHSSHKREFERVVDGIARELRDKHGISIDTKRILETKE